MEVKAGVFIGPEIRKLMGDKKFDANLNSKEKAGWDQFCLIVKNFLGNYKKTNILTWFWGATSWLPQLDPSAINFNGLDYFYVFFIRIKSKVFRESLLHVISADLY